MTAADELAATQAFFTPRAAGWETRFPDDQPRYDQAVAELAPQPGMNVVDVGCGTGRALPALHAAVGAAGRVLAVDATHAMLITARAHGRAALAGLAQADALRLPLPEGWAAVLFAGGLLPHLADPGAGLREFRRVARPGARLAIFHPLSRAALAARHNGVPSDDDTLAPGRLTRLLTEAGWRVVSIDDGRERYLALAERISA
jgi:SAM-dependent methyltransferase